MALRNALTYIHRQEQPHLYTDAELATYRLSVPPPATPFKPTQMSSSTGRAHDNVRVLLYLLKRHSFIRDNGIVLGM